MGGNRYEWIDSSGPQDMKPVAMPDWFLELIRKTPPPKSKPPAEGNGDKSVLLQAAGRYADKVNAANAGSRNDAAFSLAGHLFAFRTTGGSRLDGDDVLAIVSKWNRGNTPPLSNDELAKVVG